MTTLYAKPPLRVWLFIIYTRFENVYLFFACFNKNCNLQKFGMVKLNFDIYKTWISDGDLECQNGKIHLCQQIYCTKQWNLTNLVFHKYIETKEKQGKWMIKHLHVFNIQNPFKQKAIRFFRPRKIHSNKIVLNQSCGTLIMASILAPSSSLQAQVAKVSYHPKKNWFTTMFSMYYN